MICSLQIPVLTEVFERNILQGRVKFEGSSTALTTETDLSGSRTTNTASRTHYMSAIDNMGNIAFLCENYHLVSTAFNLYFYVKLILLG